METNVANKEIQLARQEDNLQMMPIEQAKQWYNQFAEFTRSILKKDMDYGVIPGTPKPSLLKAGAEKLRFAYGLGIEFEMIDKDVNLEKPFVDYTYRCTVKSRSGQTLAQCEGNCNSMEAKFGFIWLPITELPAGTDISTLRHRSSGKKMQEFDFAISKAETGGAYGKPAEYWNRWKEAIKTGTAKRITKKSKAGKEMDAWELNDEVTLYRITNPDVVGLKNTIMKMAQKRAFVGAVLLATGASEFFTQDIEDMPINGKIYTEESAMPITVDAEIIEESNGSAASDAEMLDQWQRELDQCKTKQEMLQLYTKNRTIVDGWPELKELFKNKNKSYPNEPKSEPVSA